MKASKATVQARVEDVLRIRLDGAEFWQVREYAREQRQVAGSVWESERPLSDGQLWRYIARSDKLIAESCRASRKRLLRRHLAQRRNLYARAVAAGDVRTALACARDEADLQGLYPPKRREVSGAGGGPVRVTLEDLLDGEPSHEPDDAGGAAGRSEQVP
jgi:hypothetical protein